MNEPSINRHCIVSGTVKTLPSSKKCELKKNVEISANQRSSSAAHTFSNFNPLEIILRGSCECSTIPSNDFVYHFARWLSFVLSKSVLEESVRQCPFEFRSNISTEGRFSFSLPRDNLCQKPCDEIQTSISAINRKRSYIYSTCPNISNHIDITSIMRERNNSEMNFYLNKVVTKDIIVFVPEKQFEKCKIMRDFHVHSKDFSTQPNLFMYTTFLWFIVMLFFLYIIGSSCITDESDFPQQVIEKKKKQLLKEEKYK